MAIILKREGTKRYSFQDELTEKMSLLHFQLKSEIGDERNVDNPAAVTIADSKILLMTEGGIRKPWRSSRL